MYAFLFLLLCEHANTLTYFKKNRRLIIFVFYVSVLGSIKGYAYWS